MAKKKTRKKSSDKTVEIINVMADGKLFTSQGVLKPGDRAALPATEAKHFVDAGKASIPFPETDIETGGDVGQQADVDAQDPPIEN